MLLDGHRPGEEAGAVAPELDPLRPFTEGAEEAAGFGRDRQPRPGDDPAAVVAAQAQVDQGVLAAAPEAQRAPAVVVVPGLVAQAVELVQRDAQADDGRPVATGADPPVHHADFEADGAAAPPGGAVAHAGGDGDAALRAVEVAHQRVGLAVAAHLLHLDEADAVGAGEGAGVALDVGQRIGVLAVLADVGEDEGVVGARQPALGLQGEDGGGLDAAAEAEEADGVSHGDRPSGPG